MKTEALSKALAAAREQAGSLRYKADQLGQTARAAKDKARQAKSRLKLAKQEAKQARKTAEEAKRAFGEASRAAEEAAVKLASLVKRLQKARQKAARGPTKNGKGKLAVVPQARCAESPKDKEDGQAGQRIIHSWSKRSPEAGEPSQFRTASDEFRALERTHRDPQRLRVGASSRCHGESDREGRGRGSGPGRERLILCRFCRSGIGCRPSGLGHNLRKPDEQ